MAELNHTDTLMAEALKRAKPTRENIGSCERQGATTAWENCIIEIAKALGTPRGDPYNRFNRQKFIEACGVEGSLVD